MRGAAAAVRWSPQAPHKHTTGLINGLRSPFRAWPPLLASSAPVSLRSASNRREAVLLVPAALSVADQHQLIRGHHARSARERSETQRGCWRVTEEMSPWEAEERCWHGERKYRSGEFGGRRLLKADSARTQRFLMRATNQREERARTRRLYATLNTVISLKGEIIVLQLVGSAIFKYFNGIHVYT